MDCSVKGVILMIDKLYDRADDFAAALGDLAKQFSAETSMVCRKASMDLWGKVMEDNPRDTSRSAAGWILTPDLPSEFMPEEGQPAYTPPDAKDPGPAKSDVWHLVNNVEYVSFLEDGHSKQKPTGFIANAMEAFAGNIKRQTAGTETLTS